MLCECWGTFYLGSRFTHIFYIFTEGLVAWCRHDEPVGNALFWKPMHIAFTKWFVPSPMNSPFRSTARTLHAKLREPLVQTGHLRSVTVTFGLQLFVFVHDFPLERKFSLCFSLAIGSSSSFFFLSCMHVLPGRLGESGARVRTGLPWVRSEPNPMDHKRG